MVEHSALDIMCLNKYCHSSSSSSSSENDKKDITKEKISLSGDYPKKNAEFLSGQYGTNLLLAGVAMMLANIPRTRVVKEEHLLSFLTCLMIIQLIWMMWYILVRNKRKNTRTERDVHATSSWIRGGLSLLAVLSLIMDAFRIGYYVGDQSCVSAVLAVYPVIHATHTMAQVHFLWFHIKDVIKSFETFERFGVIHAVFTNLNLWCNGVMSEAEHFLTNHVRRLHVAGYENVTAVHPEALCNCTSSSCTLFYTSVSYLYPFNIEYHIFVSALLFVMWKNIGRTIDLSHPKRLPTKTHNLAIGPVLGLLALGSTIGILVVYISNMDDSIAARESAISMFYIFGIVILSVMCFAGASGLIIYRADHVPLDTSKNPSRQLDIELLFGSSIGAWFMSWCSIVAVFGTNSNPSYRWLNFAYSLLIVFEKYIQNLFIVESLYRQQEEGEKDDPELPSSEIFSVNSSLGTSFNGIINQAFEASESPSVTVENELEDNGQVDASQDVRKSFEGPLPLGNQVVEPRNIKRQILKNISVFLIMCNMSLWILPAFGCRPQYDNGMEEELFGFSIWTTVLNFAIPLSLFYRMHSVASLFEVFRHV
ncbi:proton channel OTOP1 [Anabas testudineus]|uniref:Otopetrin 1 n=1 Tax=Anabas testudineus TaxID=64144 RepID=A0A3Q1JTE6_ANATE|nr:proton channel OTOP1 [Anabas testudineus]